MAVAIAAAANDNNIDAIRKVVKLLLDGKSVSEIFVDGNVGNISLERIKEIALTVQNENPMIKLVGPNVDAGRASVLNYRMQSLPSPESDGK
jgi:succinyl-CoA synthetase beta subunit